MCFCIFVFHSLFDIGESFFLNLILKKSMMIEAPMMSELLFIFKTFHFTKFNDFYVCGLSKIVDFFVSSIN